MGINYQHTILSILRGYQSHMCPLHNLVRWRIRLRKALSSSSQTTPKSDGAAENTKVKDDDQLLQEMEELTSVIDRKKKRERKRQSKRRAKVLWITYAIFATCVVNLIIVLMLLWILLFQDKARKATGMQIDATGDNYGDPDLFSISAIKVM
jgi:AdoMet-dependent rRNA methyltransferase SPB1